jgi:aminopeptidase N
MKLKYKIMSMVLFIIFFLVGWYLGISPIKESYIQAKHSTFELKENLFRGFYGSILPNYISELQYSIDILHYDLNINLFPEEKLLKGNCVITGIRKDRTLKQIDLNFFDNLKITYLSLNNADADFLNEGSRLSILSIPAELDTFILNILYSGTPKKSGLSAFVFGELNGKSVVYNLSQPTYASAWFPCNDLPDDKAQLDIRITNESSRISVSNGVLVGVEVNGNRSTYHWKTYYPISTYLICIYSSEYVKFRDQYISINKADTMDIEYYVFEEHLENAKIDFEDHPQMIEFFANTFGEYPFIKEKYGVAEFLWQVGAMEHQTISGIGSNFVSGKKYFSDIYVHELAHHWWGNAVGPKSWKDIWLNEGFATYSEALYDEYLFGKDALRSAMLSKYQEHFKGRLYNPEGNLFSTTIYNKGAWVLHMLRWEVGDSSFFRILKEYFERYKYKSASTEDFRQVCEEISGQNLERFYNQWLYNNESKIELGLRWNSVLNDSNYQLNLKFEQLQKEFPVFIFHIGAKIILDNEEAVEEVFFIDQREKTFSLSVKNKPIKIVLDPDLWLLAAFEVNEDLR